MAFATTGDCINSAQGTYTALLAGDDIESFIAEKTTGAYRQGLAKITEGLSETKQKVAKLQEDVNQLFEDILQVKVDAPSEEQLQTSVGEHQLNELVGEDFSIEKVGNIFTITGTIEDVDYSETFEDADTNFFVPVVLTANVGAVVKYTEVVTGNEVEKTFGTDNIVTRSIPKTASMALVIPITEEQRIQTISLYDDVEEAATGKGAQEFTIDASAVVLNKLGYYSVTSQEDFETAIAGDISRDGNIHVNIDGEVTLDKPHVFTKPTIVDGGDENKIVTSSGLSNYVADVEYRDITVETTASIGWSVGKDDGSPKLIFDNVDIIHKPAKSHSTLELAETIRLQTKSTVTPVVTLKNGTTVTTTSSADGKPTEAIMLSSIDNSTGGGSVTVDNSTITINNTKKFDEQKTRAFFVAAPSVEVTVTNGSVVSAPAGRAFVALYTNDITVDDSTVSGHTIAEFGGNSSITTTSTVSIENSSTVTATNSFTTAGAHNDAAVYFGENTSNCEFVVDETSTLKTVAGPIASNNEEYVATFDEGEDNTVQLNNSFTCNNGNGLMFIHGLTEDKLLYDTTDKGDSIVLNGSAANGCYVVTDNSTSEIINATSKLATALKVAKAFQDGDTSKRVTITKGINAPATDGTVMTEGVTLIER